MTHSQCITINPLECSTLLKKINSTLRYNEDGTIVFMYKTQTYLSSMYLGGERVNKYIAFHI